ncbi:EAL domain-containing protein [Kineococcus sp. SYSU DK001]|uniref:EAL domain-containing protein n=1 Tax=Kineococcus sp. SYSU DK001 TaxID=3383122 RepID=UPI003D7C958A
MAMAAASDPEVPDHAGHRELRAVYQPVVELDSGRVVAVEGLVRARRDGAELSPARLFADAGPPGGAAALRLDAECLRCVLTGAGSLPAGATLFVNVEPPTLGALSHQDLAELSAVLDPGVQVVVEVTERDLLHDPAQLLAGIARVRELGWAVALDDVGAEPAALALMPFLRPQLVKLDLALVRARPSLDVAAIVNAVHAEAQRSGALVLAEGIETPEHLRRALGMGARLGQGWHFAHPGPPPARWGAPLALPPTPPAPTAATTAFDVLRRDGATRPTTPDLLAALTRHVERQAMLLDEATVVLSSFQHSDSFTTATRRRYEALAAVSCLTAVLGPGMSATPVPGVRGRALADDDPVGAEWVVTVVSPHFAAALAARDAGGDGPAPARLDAGTGPQRPMTYVLSYDRDQVIEAANVLMSRVHVSAPEPDGAGEGTTGAPGERAGTGGERAGTTVTLRPADGVSASMLGGVAPAELPGLLTRAIATASNGIVIADATAPDLPLVYVNTAFEQMTGYGAQQVLGRNCRLLQGPGTDRTQVRVIARRLLTGRTVQTTLLNYRHDGTPFWNEITISPVHDSTGRLTHFIGNQSDVSDRVERERRTAHLAYHDSLTGLPNRARIVANLERELRRSARTGDAVAVVLADLEDIRSLNDRLGHEAGDWALVHAARRLRAVVRTEGFVGRLAGNEFLLVLPDLPPGDDGPVRDVVRRLHESLEEPVNLPGGPVRLRADLGSALAPRDGLSAAALVDAARARTGRGDRGPSR